MKFDKQFRDTFRDEVTKLLAPLTEKYPLTIEAGMISYEPDHSRFTVKVECARTDMGDLNEKEFAKYCYVFGMKPEDYNREFTYRRSKYRLIGFFPNSHKYPCKVLEVSTGKEYKFVLEDVKNLLNLEQPAAGGTKTED